MIRFACTISVACALLVATSGRSAAQPPVDDGDAPNDDAEPVEAAEEPAEPVEPAPAPEPVEPEPAEPPAPPGEELPLEEVAEDEAWEDEFVAEEPSDFVSRLYGYIDSQWRRPLGEEDHHHEEEGLASASEEHAEGFDLQANVMFQGTIVQRYRFFVNLIAFRAGDVAFDRSLDLRNAWVEAPLFGDYLAVRVGKTYRRFGLYNEILDARPTFMGIEPPEMLVRGHLLMTRTTNLMVHGTAAFDDHIFTYALMTGGDESAEGAVPIGADLHYDFGDILRIGTSFYWTGGDAQPTSPFGSGPMNGGVMAWMERDEYYVYGGYAQLTWEGLTIQAEYWRSPHEATRDVDDVLELARRARLTPNQRRRLFGTTISPTADDVNTTADYTVRTFWARLGYEIVLGDFGALTPYVHFDYLHHPEAIADEGLGGNEAGLSENDRFMRVAGGFVYRPIAPVAFKAELNPHFTKRDGETQVSNELRLSLSYYWELW